MLKLELRSEGTLGDGDDVGSTGRGGNEGVPHFRTLEMQFLCTPILQMVHLYP